MTDASNVLLVCELLMTNSSSEFQVETTTDHAVVVPLLIGSWDSRSWSERYEIVANRVVLLKTRLIPG